MTKITKKIEMKIDVHVYTGRNQEGRVHGSPASAEAARVLRTSAMAERS